VLGAVRGDHRPARILPPRASRPLCSRRIAVKWRRLPHRRRVIESGPALRQDADPARCGGAVGLCADRYQRRFPA
jgi:hypothetical protein